MDQSKIDAISRLQKIIASGTAKEFEKAYDDSFEVYGDLSKFLKFK